MRVSRKTWGVLGLAVVAQVGFSITEQGIPALTGFIKTDLGVSAAVAGLIVACFPLGRIVGSYAAGIAADRFGERRVLIAGGMAGGALTVLAASAPVAALCGLFLLSGAASAAATPAGGRMVLAAFPPHRHGLALGVRQTGIPLGGLIATAALPSLAHAAGWRWALVVAGVLTVAFVLPLLRVELERSERPIASHGPSPGRDRDVKLTTLWGSLVVVGQYSLLAFLALDVHEATGRSLASASILVVVAQAFGIGGRLLWGWLSDRGDKPRRKPMLLALTTTGLLAALLLVAVPRSAPFAVLMGVAAVAGASVVGFQGLWVTMLAELAPAGRVGATTGFAITFTVTAVTLTPPVLGLVADVAGTYRAIWVVLAGLLTLAFVPALLVREPRDRLAT
ncbi:MFS transporter [Solirubrobacter soli]|uniref:MFS transporter n=1 Tax=Solirubrobacter soli TaxID=363832 RepID=UPI00040B73D2|nr:MFS transporter [Solirubrobacter soli]